MEAAVQGTFIPMSHGMLVAAILFSIGLVGLLVRRNIILMLMCAEIMLNAAGLAFIVAGWRWGAYDGQIMFLFIITLAAAEVAVGLALVIQLYRAFKSLDVDLVHEMRG